MVTVVREVKDAGQKKKTKGWFLVAEWGQSRSKLALRKGFRRKTEAK